MLQIAVTRRVNTAALTLVIAAVAPSVAQTPAQVTAERNPDRIGEVIVTAQRRAESLQDVPVAISALTEEQLAQRDIKDVSDIALVTPGVSYVRLDPGRLSS
jgi:iron complex outermembrane receptor protein